MRINILSTIGHKPGGLNRVLLEYAHHLVLNGHEVRVIKPVDVRPHVHSMHQRLKRFVFFGFRPRIKPHRCFWMRCAADFFIAPFCANDYIPDADVTIFSSVKIKNLVADLHSTKGKKIMIIQDIHFAQSSLAIPENILAVAVSTFARNKLHQRLGERNIYFLSNGVNLKLFSNLSKTFRPAKTIGMVLYSKKPPHKGMEDGIAVFEAIKKKYPHLELLMVGLKKEKWIPKYVRFFKGVDQKMLVDFYRSVDIFLYPSHLDACALPPMEAMACKCAVITTDVGAVSDYAIAGKTALVSPPKSMEGLVSNLDFLVEKPDKLKEVALAGYEKIQEFSWERQTLELERIIRDAV